MKSHCIGKGYSDFLLQMPVVGATTSLNNMSL